MNWEVLQIQDAKEKMKLNKAQVKPILEKTFPDYKGRKYSIEFVPTVTFYDTNWGGGTRNVYRFVRSDGAVGCMNIPAPWINVIEGRTVDIPVDVLVVKHAVFCGQDLGITIYANPVHMPKWLPEGGKLNVPEDELDGSDWYGERGSRMVHSGRSG